MIPNRISSYHEDPAAATSRNPDNSSRKKRKGTKRGASQRPPASWLPFSPSFVSFG
jgi:hypothetical protein